MTTPESTTSGIAAPNLQVSVSVGSNIPAELGQQIDAAVRLAVLTQLAQADIGPGFRLAALAPEEPSAIEIGGQTHYGIFLQVNF